MDTSETYIKMCDCPEIQDYWWERGVQEGDFLWDRTQDPKAFYFNFGKLELAKEPVDRSKCALWLPRQDQLQEMFTEDNDMVGLWGGIVQLLYEYILSLPDKGLTIPSMEQLWLAFVTKEKHNKVWNGEEWGAFTTVYGFLGEF